MCDIPMPRAMWHFTLENLCNFFSALQNHLFQIIDKYYYFIDLKGKHKINYL